MNSINLKEYLKCLYDLETSLLTQQYALNLLYTKINELKNIPDEPYLERNTIEKKITSDHILTGCFIGYIVVAIFAACVTVVDGFFNRLVVGILTGFVGIPIGIPIGLIIGVVKSSKEAERIRKSNEEIDRQNDLIAARNREQRKRNQDKINLLWQQESILQENIHQTTEILQQYYNLNIVHEKYRGLIPICSIYGYLDTGVCSELEGHEGAYNKYDLELRLNYIIAKLDVIISHLEEIKENQKMLYNAICRASHKLSEISSGIDRLNTKADKIIYNTEVANQNIEFLNNWQVYNSLMK